MYFLKYSFFGLLSALSISLWGMSFFHATSFLPFYGILMFVYFSLQIITSALNSRNTPLPLDDGPSVSILVVGYREDLDLWTKCLNSIKNQEYQNIKEIVVSIDGNEEGDLPMYNTAAQLLADHHVYETAITIIQNDHGGKRSAMYHGFKHIQSNPPDYVIVTDSDTILDEKASGALVACIDSDPKNGCATGSLTVYSKHLLGRIVNARYAYAFNIERASMSYFGVMNCCSGPLSIYRSSLLSHDVLEAFVNQICYGEKCGPGDDRHLTCLVLLSGYKSRQTSYAIAATEAPISMKKFIVQQSRWIRSFYREVPWQVKSIGFQSPALAIITHFEMLYPFLIFIWVIVSLILGKHVLRGGVIALSVIILRTAILFFYMNFNPAMIWNLAYLPMYFTCILPLKLVGLMTVREMMWTSKTRDGSIQTRSPILPFIAIFVWNSYIVASIVVWVINNQHRIKEKFPCC